MKNPIKGWRAVMQLRLINMYYIIIFICIFTTCFLLIRTIARLMPKEKKNSTTGLTIY